MRLRKGTVDDAILWRMAKETGEPIEITDEAGVVVNVLHVPGPMPPDPIDRVRQLLARPPKPNRVQVHEARRLDGFDLFGRYVALVALVDAIREAARES